MASLLCAGIGIGLICIGITDFDYIEETEKVGDVYNIEMTENLIIETPLWNAKVKHIETDSDEIKIVVNRNKYNKTKLVNLDEKFIKISCYYDDTKVMESIRDTIKDLNNKKIRSQSSSIPEMYIYTTKSNFDKIEKVARW